MSSEKLIKNNIDDIKNDRLISIIESEFEGIEKEYAAIKILKDIYGWTYKKIALMMGKYPHTVSLNGSKIPEYRIRHLDFDSKLRDTIKALLTRP